MKKKWQTRVIMGLMALSLSFCSGPDKGDPNSNQQKSPAVRVSEEKPIDIEKLDIPEKMRKAIKSGKIPKDRVLEFLARQKGNTPLVEIKATRQKITIFEALRLQA